MILAELTRYLATHRRVSLPDLAWHFDADPDAVRGMLAVLERKGRVRRLANGTACAGSGTVSGSGTGGGCGKCDQAQMESYEWLGRATDHAPDHAPDQAPGQPSQAVPGPARPLPG